MKAIKDKIILEHSGPCISKKNGFNIIDCEVCNFAHVNPIPTENELIEIYKHDYYSSEKPNYIKHYLEDKEWWNTVYDKRLTELESLSINKHEPSILDIGSGPGLFLNRAKDRGWTVQGVEPSVQAYQYSISELRLPVENCYLDSNIAAKLPKYDVVHLGEVLEHIPNPQEMLKLIRTELLTVNGLIAVVVPNDFNAFQRVLSKDLGYDEWWVSPPHHLNYFNHESLKVFIEEQRFEVVSMSSTFPIDIFLMMGINYIGDEEKGRYAHSLRKKFDLNLNAASDDEFNHLKDDFYQKISDLGLGREIWCVARAVLGIEMNINKQKRILILGAGVEQTLAIKQAKSLGYYVVALDGNPTAKGKDFSDVFLNIDIVNVDEVINIGRKLKVDGVFCHAVEIPHVVAAVAEALGLPGNSTLVAENATIKAKRIKILKESGVNVPDYWVIKDKQELDEVNIPLEKFPLVIKPVDCAGARGVMLVSSLAELRSAYEIVLGFSKDSTVLVEQFLEGPQISTEAFVTRDDVITYAFADRNYESSSEFAPYFVEDGINFPTELPDEIQNLVVKETIKAIRALGIEFGAAKGDVILHNNQPYILEMAARTSGGWFSAGSIPAATGINPLVPLIQIAVGDEPDLTQLNSNFTKGCAQRYWIPKIEGVIKNVGGFEKLKFVEGIEMFESFFPKVGMLIHKSTNHAERYAQVICTAETRPEAIERAEKAIRLIEVELELVGD